MPRLSDLLSDARVAAVLVNGERPTGAMVALVPSNPEALVVPGGDPAGQLHVTLKYLPDAADWDDERRQLVQEAVEAWANRQTGPFEATVTGVGPLGDEGAVVLFLDAPGLHDARADLNEDLTALPAPDGVDTADTYPTYRPHLTVGYDVDEPAAPATPITLQAVEVHWAGERVATFPLGSAVTANTKSRAQRQREWDESKVKRNRGRFSRTQGPRAAPNSPVTNSRTGATGKVIGRTRDGKLLVRQSDGKILRWDPKSTKPGIEKKGGKGRKGGRGTDPGDALRKMHNDHVKQALRKMRRDADREERRKEAEQRRVERERQRAKEKAAREAERAAEKAKLERQRKRERTNELKKDLREAVKVAKEEGRSPFLRVGGDKEEIVEQLKDAGITVVTRNGQQYAQINGNDVLLLGVSRRRARVSATGLPLTAEAREDAADEGYALPDGKLPIRTKEEVRSAVKLRNHVHGHSELAIRRHITKRARALGATDLLPDEWKRKS